MRVVQGVGDGFGVAPARTPSVLVCEGTMELERKRAEGGDGWRVPILRDKACGLSGSRREKLGGGLDDVYVMIRRRYAREGMRGRKANDSCTENDCRRHVVYRSLRQSEGEMRKDKMASEDERGSPARQGGRIMCHFTCGTHNWPQILIECYRKRSTDIDHFILGANTLSVVSN